MGRPSRKIVASTVMLEDPSGEIFLFSIDKKGRSTFICKDHQLSFPSKCQKPEDMQSMMTSIVLDDNLKPKNSVKPINQNNCPKKTSKYRVESKKFDMFLSEIDKNLGIDDFLKTNKLSFMMLPIITD
ncbi:hypothetical protein M9Y10_030670 [Tritrichomonas musculus]|uniref:Uncharacterized protein n=1 Tax=Tritrichomonas musculus TaxID=1915356 RepID=A0ABR2H2S0_9EUKA